MRSEGGICFSSVCACMRSVCLFVNAITHKPFEISSRNLCGSKIGSNARTSSKMAAIRGTAARERDLTSLTFQFLRNMSL